MSASCDKILNSLSNMSLALFFNFSLYKGKLGILPLFFERIPDENKLVLLNIGNISVIFFSEDINGCS